MHGLAEWHWNIAEEALRLSGKYLENSIKAWEAAIQEVKASQIYLGGIGKYIADFMVPYWSALDTFCTLKRKAADTFHRSKPLVTTWNSYSSTCR